ncbi:MAG TPA: GDSL-type esterase/lipase family protein, partial [Longimicrobium sp.]
EMRFLALGDSYTIGEGVDEAERWPVRLAALLRARGVPVADPDIIARTGWTTDELAAAIDDADPRGPYALVSLLVGVNNQYRGRGAEEYRVELTELLRRAAEFAGGDARRVMVLSIPDWGVTPFADGRDRARIAAEIDAFNAIAREAAARAGARWVDVTPQTRAAGAAPAFLVGDGLHPSGRSYAEWARLALPAALEAIASAGR